jgi:hypothetical protein
MANEQLLIANFNTFPIKGQVSSNAGGPKIPVTAGPQSFILVTDAAVTGPLPWTVDVQSETPAHLPVTKLPAIAAFGVFPPSGAQGYGYLTSVVYP